MRRRQTVVAIVADGDERIRPPLNVGLMPIDGCPKRAPTFEVTLEWLERAGPPPPEAISTHVDMTREEGAEFLARLSGEYPQSRW
jgi:hypothetical protein